MNLEQLERRLRMTQESFFLCFRKGHFVPSYGKGQTLRCTFKQPGVRKSNHPFSLHLPQLWGKAHNSRCIKPGRQSTAQPTAPSSKVPTRGVRKSISTVSNHRVGSPGGLRNPICWGPAGSQESLPRGFLLPGNSLGWAASSFRSLTRLLTREVAPTLSRRLNGLIWEYCMASERSPPVRIPLEDMWMGDSAASWLVAILSTKARVSGARCV